MSLVDALGRRGTLALAALLVAALLGGQALADRLALRDAHAATGQLIGRTSYAYLTGIRTYVAAVLWARLDPINDRYYQSVTLGRKKFLMPSILMVTVLDPDFEEPFYAGPFILFDAGLKANARELAAEGVRRNPDSGRLHASYAQLLLVEGDLTHAAPQADLALAGKWTDPSDEFNALPALEVVYNHAGQRAKARYVAALRARIGVRIGVTGSAPATGTTRPAPGTP